MILVNLIRGEFLSPSDNWGQQVLCKRPPIGPFQVDSTGLPASDSQSLPASLHPRLMERLLGKSPLRLVLKRTLKFRGCYQETLECGHRVTTYQEFLWDDKAHLVLLEPTAKRRRCQECKAVAASSPAELPSPKKPSQSVGRDEKRRLG